MVKWMEFWPSASRTAVQIQSEMLSEESLMPQLCLRGRLNVHKITRHNLS